MKIRKNVYSLDQYLKLLKNETIRTDQECQRRSEQWKPGMISELLITVMTGNYIPPIILGEEVTNGITRTYIIDGLQRSSSLSMFRYGNTRIAKSIDEYMVAYQRKVLDESGNVKRDGHGEIIWESVQYDIRNKTYDQLPEELKDRFDEYQIETVIYQNCEQTEISKLVRRFNNHIGMNTAQKAFNYIDAFAREIRDIAENRFFLNTYTCCRNDRKNGTLERVICDTVLLCNYPDQYRKESKVAFLWLNNHGTIADFDSMDVLLTRLATSLETTKEIKALFNSKHTHIFVAAFKAFTESGRKDEGFGDFLEWFVNGGSDTTIDGKSWNELDGNKATRDSNVVHGKLDYLVALFGKYDLEIRKAA